jgi:hypothetical protein
MPRHAEQYLNLLDPNINCSFLNWKLYSIQGKKKIS